MGIVIKQTIKGSLYSYLGVILGGINVALLFPTLFSEEQVGLINILMTVSAVSAQFASLGAAGIINYFFPKYRNKENAHHSFFVFISLFASIGFLLFTIVFFFWGDLFLSTREMNTSLQDQYYHLIYPLTFFSVAFIVVDIFSAATFNSYIGNLYKDVIVRIIILGLLVLYYFQLITFSVFLLFYTLNLAVPVVALLIYLVRRGDASFKLPAFGHYKPNIKKIFSVGFFYILSGLSDILASYIDKYMISYFLGLKSTGIYSITFYFGTLTRIPRSSMGKIGTPVIARLIDEKNYEELSVLLKKSSLSQIFLGVFIFINIWINIDLILSVLPASYAQGKMVVFYISFSHIFYCFMGLGGVTLKVSKYYKTATVFTFLLGIMVVVFNLLLIPSMGIEGAALSTAVAKLIYVVLILIYVAYRFKISIVNLDSFKLLFSGILAMVLVQYLPQIKVEYHQYVQVGINIVIKSLAVTMAYIILLRIVGFIKDKKQLTKLF